MQYLFQKTRALEGSWLETEGRGRAWTGRCLLGPNSKLKGLEGGCVWERERKADRAVCI